MLHIEDIRELCTDDTIVLTEHLLTRMRQRQIRWKDIKHTIEKGEIIEQYPADYPFPNGKPAAVEGREAGHEMRDLTISR